MTADDIAKGRALAAAATDGPWGWHFGSLFCVGSGVTLLEADTMFDPRREDLTYIVHACNTLPAALAEVERLRALVEETFYEGCLEGRSGEWGKSDAKEALG